MSDEDEEAVMRALWQDAEQRRAAATAFYEMLKKRHQLASRRVLTYRCARRCLLADVFDTNRGLLVHQPRYKSSQTRNQATSSPEARAVNTEDGDRHWKSRTFFLSQAANLTLSCDHIAYRILEIHEIGEAVTRHEQEVIV